MVEGTGLENQRFREGSVGSNPTLSANWDSVGNKIILTNRTCIVYSVHDWRSTQEAEEDGLLNR